MPTRLFIIDPLEVTRVGIRLTCEAFEEFEVVGEAESVPSAINQVLELRPTVVVFGCDTSGDEAQRALQQVCQANPAGRVLVYSALDQAPLANLCMQSGAAGFLVKSTRIDDLLTAIRSLADGRVFISHSVADQQPLAAPHFLASQNGLQPSSITKGTLSQREREVITMVANGFTNRQIAERLYLSIKTVETYRARVMRKHALSDRAAVMQFARKFGLTEQLLS
jgi:two-component system, NarL family, response regulator NreC